MQKLLNRLGRLCSMMDTPLLIIYDKTGISSWARYGIDADIVQTPAALYTLYRYERLFISLAKPSLLKRDASAFKSQSHQIALGTSESSPNCMESIPVLDASQNFKICISFPSLDIKSFFVLNLLYRPFCVNLLFLIFINIIIYFKLLYLVLVYSPNHSIRRLHKRFHFLSIRKTHEAPFSRKAFVRLAYMFAIFFTSSG